MARDDVLNREVILEGRMQKIARERPGLIRLMTDEERDDWVTRMVHEATSLDDIWVFGYGSLIWNPAFIFADRERCRIRGYHRSFCLWTKLGRGCEDNPGLMLGLERGGSCTGVVYRIDADDVASELDIVFRRELLSYAYIPTWVNATLETPGDESDRVVRAIAFVMDPTHERFCKGESEETIVQHLATAVGPLGRNCDYLYDLVDHLKELNFTDQRLESLAEKVRAHQLSIGIDPDAAHEPDAAD